MIGINGWELLALLFLAVVILGPERLPEYAAKLAHGIRKLRVMAEGAKGQLKDQLGPEYEDINWRQYDPRQYDPRRIVKEALMEPLESTSAALRDVASPDLGAQSSVLTQAETPQTLAAASPNGAATVAASAAASHHAGGPVRLRTPFDDDAT